MNSSAHPPADANGLTELCLSGTFEGDNFDVIVNDKEVLEAIQRFDRPEDGIGTLLRVGASACHAAAAGLDLHAVRREVDAAVRGACDAIGELREDVRLVAGNDGPLAASLHAAASALIAQIQQAVVAQGDAESPGTLLAKVQLAAKSFEETMATHRKQISEDLAGAVDKHSQAVTNAVREMRDLDPNSAIGGAFSRVEAQLKDLGEKVAAAQASAGERMRSAAKGGDFEDEVAAVVAAIAAVHGDRAERTGDQPGKVIQNSRPSKRGDVTCFVGDAPAIAVEAMDRGADQLKAKAVGEELEEAMRNRDTVAAIAVVASGDNTLMCQQPIQVLAKNRWAVLYDRAERSSLALQVAYRLAREVATTPNHADDAVDIDRIRTAVDEVNKRIAMLGDVRTQLANIRSCHDKAADALAKYERQVKDAITGLIALLTPECFDEAA